MESGRLNFVLSPARSGTVDTAIAASRAGWVGVLNAEFDAQPRDLALLLERLSRFGKAIGVKLPAVSHGWLDLVAGSKRPLDVVIVSADAVDIDGLAALRSAARLVMIEVCAFDARIAEMMPHTDGVWLKGHESGGFVGEQTSFILLREFARRTDKPLHVRGGVNPDSAAAVCVGGASGVVLDDQLLLIEESPLRSEWTGRLKRFTGVETVFCDGGASSRHLRFWSPPGMSGARTLAAEIARAGAILPHHAERLGWGAGEAGELIPPLGQDGAVAVSWAEKYKRVANALRAIEQSVADLPARAAALNPLGEGSPLAKTHRTRFPIVQGPMTHVSDRAAFVKAVADGGALPMAALSLMRGDKVKELLAECRELVGGLSWGVGMLGFVPPETMEDQRAALIASRPDFAIIAGGRPDQAREMEASGIRTYLHVPSPTLLAQFVEQGSRSFIFEGRECGGHIGPLASFVLWHVMTEALLAAKLTHEEASQHQILFAGGIHDGVSCAMAAVMATRLADAGFQIGVLAGTAYIFTEEAVRTGAITPTFQKIAVTAERTASLATGPGHASRCVVTPFVEQFRERKVAMESAGAPSEDVRNELENLTLGRLRLASKGVARKHDASPELETRSENDQRDGGMYMIGQAATLLGNTTTVAELHREICEGALATLNRAVGEARPAYRRSQSRRPGDIAIIGMSAVLPGAANAREYWRNILNKVSAITEIPLERWDASQYFDADRSARDRIYSRWGGFAPDIRFDPAAFGMPPNSVPAIDPLQLMALAAIQDVIDDAGLSGRTQDAERTSVILGFSGGLGELGVKYATRTELFRAGGASAAALEFLPEWSEDSFAGLLPNVAAGRAANRFDFGGVNCTVDAACASSLAALYQAVLELESERSDVVITGGVDTVQGPFGFTCFSKAQALSPSGRSRTFDATADGIAISEGVAMVALKRLADAERDGDRVYAVIKGVGGSSDGKAKGLMAPRPHGQKRAMRRAYEQAGYSPASVELFEAHGTGTAAGDRAELESLTDILNEENAAPRSVAVGSVKTMIGHTKSSAGIAGLLKTALALHHKVLPPHMGVETPNPALANEASPLYLSQEPRPWTKGGTPRRAGVSSFGFGGTNFHVTLEEYSDAFRSVEAPDAAWPVELFVWRAADRAGLIGALRDTLSRLREGAPATPASLAAELAGRAPSTGLGVAIVACTLEVLAKKLADMIAHVEGGAGPAPAGCYFTDAPLGADGKLAIVFSGQGSQYPDMLRELAARASAFRAVLDAADAATARTPTFAGSASLSHRIFPPARFSPVEEAAASSALMMTNVTQPALAAIEAGAYACLRELGVRPDMICGHSFGEFTALWAAGVLETADLFGVAEARGRAIVEATRSGGLGSMIASLASENETRAAIGDLAGVHFANYNGPKQVILSGADQPIAEALRLLEAAGVTAKKLPVSAAFHSPLMEPAREPLAAYLSERGWSEPAIPVYSNATGAPHGDAAAIRSAMVDHLTGPVRFAQTIERMHADGARVFLEVGPKTVLRDLVAANLLGKPHVAVAIDGKGGDFAGFVHALGMLFVHGVPFDPRALTADRETQIAAEVRAIERKRAPLKPSEWLINGGQAKKPGAPVVVKAAVAAAPSPPQEPRAATPAAAPSAEPAQDGWIRITGLAARSPALAKPASFNLEVGEPVMSSSYDSRESGAPPDSAVLHDYFALMRQFLQSQERVMKGYLGNAQSRQPFADAFAMEPAAPALSSSAFVAPPPVQATVVAAAPAPTAPVAAHANGHQNGHANGQANGHANGHANGAAAAAPGKDIKSLLLTLVTDRTGYPEDMLSLDADIEGDLGIDSIKRTEILGVMRKELPAAAGPQLEARMQELAKAKSLGRIIAIVNEALALEGAKPAAGANGSSPPPFELSGKEESGCAVLSRFIIKAHAEPADDVALSEPLPGAYVVLAGDKEDVALRLAERIVKAGGRCIIAAPAVWRNPVAFGRWLGDIKTEDTIRAIVNLGPMDDPSMPATAGLAEWKARVARDVKSFFPVLKVAADDLSRGGVVIAASAMGGLFARDASAREGAQPWPAPAGNVGLLKCLSLEWTEARCKAVDLDPSDEADAQAAHLFRELFLPGGRREIGYPGGQRTIFRTEPATVARTAGDARQPNSDWVVLAVGGARGVTAETLREIAKAGATLILVSRTGAPAAEAPALAALHTKADLQRYFIEEARLAGKKVAPAQIESACARVLRDRETRANLADFEGFGAKIDVRAIDMRDGAAVKALVDSLYAKYGRIDAVFFGAGVIEDQLIANKTDESVSRVIDAKVDGAFNLAGALNAESLKFFGLFTSVAGRYGNRGQTDYGAANEILNQFALQMQAKWGPQVKVAAINWGPWAGVTHGAGMVTPDTRRQFEERGVSLIEPATGLAFMMNEVIHAPADEVESVAGDNPWEYMEAAHGAFRSETADPLLSCHPMLAARAKVSRSDSMMIVRKRIDLVSDPYLDHHRIDRKPVMPFVVGAEHLAEAACLFGGFNDCAELRDIRFFKGVTLQGDSVEIEIRMKEAGEGIVDGEIWVMGEKPVRAYAAQAVKDSSPAALPAAMALGAARSAATVQKAYTDWLFHGPLFQTLTRVVSLDGQRLVAELDGTNPVNFYPPAKGSSWQFDPGVLDGALQCVLIWSRALRDETSLPTRMGRLCRIGTEALDGPLTVDMRFLTDPAVSSSVCDFTVADRAGRIRYIVEKLEAASTGALNRIGGSMAPWSLASAARSVQG